MKRFLTFFALTLLVSTSLYAQKDVEKGSDWKISGLSQIISQMDGKDFENATHPLFYNILKTRVGVTKSIGNGVEFHASFQDSRIFGQEGVVVGNQANTNLFEGYAKINNIFNTPLSIQAGRFQMQYGTEKIIGRSFWHKDERLFDGARVSYKRDKFKLDYFHIIHTNNTPYILKIKPGLYNDKVGESLGYGIYGAWAQYELFEKNTLHAFFIMEDNETIDAESKALTGLYRNTLGINYFANFGALSGVFEFAYQMGTKELTPDGGETAETDIAASLISAKLDYKVKPIKVYAGVDMVSGTDAGTTDEINTYANYLGSKHKFYGLMDYFLDIKNGTGNAGFNDIFVGVAYPKLMKNLSANLSFHIFSTNAETTTGESALGNEIDLTFAYKMTKGATLKFGGAVFMQGERMKEMWMQGEKAREDMSFWSFMMLVVKL